MHQWIEYSLLIINGIGNQPYETLMPLGVDFDGGHYVENGRYRGRLSGTQEQIDNALLSLTIFGAQVLSETDILEIVERVVPTNTVMPGDLFNDVEQYLGPPSLTATLEIARSLSSTPF